MYLKKLEIYGFKSFADRIYIEFDRGITAIVGPNGSGKSNVADAVRWVLGEQSAKSLRGSRMEDVIFSGTQLRKPLGFAEVSLILDNSEGSLPVEFSEVTITRRVFRSGESEYYINRSLCRLRDIMELFMDTGVGKEGYSIIGQGRIEEILSTHPENRREIFEEAAGIVKYKARKEEATHKLEKTMDNIIRVEDILNEIGQQLEPLENQSQVAKKYLSLRDKLKHYQLNQFILKYDKFIERINQLKEQEALLGQDVVNHRKIINQEETKCEKNKAEMDRLVVDIQNYRDLCHGLLQNMEKYKGEIGVLKERSQQIMKETQRLEVEIIQGEEQINRKQKEKDEILRILRDNEIKLSNALETSAKLFEQIEKLRDQLFANQSEVEKKKDSILNILNNLSQARNDVTRYRTMETNLLDRQAQIGLELDSLSQSKSSLIEEQLVIDSRMKDLKKQIEAQKQKRESLDQIIIRYKNDIRDVETNIQIGKQKLEGIRSRLRVLEEMDRDYEGFQRSVKGILKACKKDQGLGKRVCGVVAELLKVPEQYEIAIETALGSGLQHIVTENEEDAKFIIDFLRKQQWGRATFLPITAIKGRSLTNPERFALKMQGCYGVASELIDFDPKYKQIFQNLLGRVVITDNLDQAIEMARSFNYSFRIVTLDGDVINPGGSMTGGSRTQKNVSLIGRSREIAGLKAQIARDSDRLENEDKRRAELRKKYETTLKKMQQLSSQLHELEIHQAAGQEQIESTRQELSRISAQAEKLENEKDKIRIDISSTRQAIRQKESDIATLEAQNSDMETIARDTEASIREIVRQKEEMDRQATEHKILIAGIKREILSLKEKGEKLNKEILQHEQAIQDRKQQFEAQTEAIQECRKQILDKQGSIEDIQKIVADKNEQISEMQTIREKQEVEIKRLEKRQKELTEIIEEITEQKHRVEVQLSRQEVELENLQNSIWEEYEISYANAIDFRDTSLSASQIEREIKEISNKMDGLGEVNVNAIDEYRRVKERFDFLSMQKQDLISAKENLRTVIKDITKTMENRFRQEFAVINRYFGEVFCRLFGGGKAELILEDPDSVLESGIEIVAQPPGKKLQNLSLMSGGEKALTAIAILFAILRKKPTPFCILDEIEAALDESNVYSFGKFLREFCQDTQFVVITHRKGTMENSDVLYGVAMEEKGVSKMVSVKLEEAS